MDTTMLNSAKNSSAFYKSGIAWEFKQKHGNLKNRIAGGIDHIVGIKYDNSLFTHGSNEYGQCDLEQSNEMIQVACTLCASFGLKKDGTLVCAGKLPSEGSTGGIHVSNWPNNLIALSAGNDHVLGLCADGRVFAYGNNDNDQCEVDAWCDIVEIYASYNTSVGVRKDGTVVVCGGYRKDLSEDGSSGHQSLIEDVSNWNNIEHVYGVPSGTCLIGLKYDGTAIAASISGKLDVSNWTDIIDVTCSYMGVIGLKGNGDICLAGEFPPAYMEKPRSGILAVYRFNQNLFYVTEDRNIIDYILDDGTVKTIEHQDEGLPISLYVLNETLLDAVVSIDGFVSVAYGLGGKPRFIIPAEERTLQNIDRSRMFLPEYTEEIVDLEMKKENYLWYGVVALLFFWPVSIYFFCRRASMSKKIKELKQKQKERKLI